MSDERTVTFQIPAELAVEAEAMGLHVSEASRKGLWLIMRHERRNAQWQEENREAIAAWAKWVDEHELPLERYRLF